MASILDFDIVVVDDPVEKWKREREVATKAAIARAERYVKWRDAQRAKGKAPESSRTTFPDLSPTFTIEVCQYPWRLPNEDECRIICEGHWALAKAGRPNPHSYWLGPPDPNSPKVMVN